MWLKYGVNEEGILICIEDVNRGKTSLKCPYCNNSLTAKKGKVKEHHFAHNDQTCRPIARANASKVLLILTKIKTQRKISISGLIYFPRLKAIAKIFVNK
jgi:competence CoiA-like predicted nuclease